MHNFFLSRREAISAAVAALLAPFGWLRPACAAPESSTDDVTGGLEPSMDLSVRGGTVTAAYRYDERGRLLSATTAVDPDGSTSWAY